MAEDTAFQDINEAKANLDHIYDEPDPRNYFSELGKLDYAIPDLAKPIFEKLVSHLRSRRNDTVHVLDLGCSYGINAVLLKYDLTMADLYDHWGNEALRAATPEEVAAHDRQFLDNLEPPADIEVVGIDLASSATAFARDAGLLDHDIVVNLETDPLPPAAKEKLAPVDLVTSTGCVGYVTEKSFERLLPAVTQGQAPWMGNFVLRLFPFDPIAETLSEWGYVTEKLEGETFPQRLFHSAEERDQVVGQLCERGIDPTGLESEGSLLAEFYLSRPAADVARCPIEQLLAA
ncbi:hypothetical protein [Parasphingorhabdus sp.]|uniref:hypothetical protein n=1 Tax=Parasphingorhabdus sp. TaxID=2709688 RepID=UPI0030027BE3